MYCLSDVFFFIIMIILVCYFDVLVRGDIVLSTSAYEACSNSFTPYPVLSSRLNIGEALLIQRRPLKTIRMDS